MSGAGPAREEALAALTLIREGMAAADALQKRAVARGLSPNDRALMAQLVYGVLRQRRYLDAWIRTLRRGPLDPVVEDILRLGFFQLGFLSRMPAYAVVHATVELAKGVQPGAAGLVNAILRRGHGHPPRDLPLAVRYSHPDWLVERWRGRFGDRVEAILQADNEVPPLTLRVNRLAADRKAVLSRLAERGVEANPSPYVPEAVRVVDSLWLENFPAFRAGWVSVQDESGMLVTWVLDPHPGDRVLDLAAGLGSKTTHILERLGGEGRVWAVDRSARRLGLLAENCRRLGLRGWETVAADGRQVASRFATPFDRVLLDAPCSGLGVLRRRVDARWKRVEADLARHQRLQRELLAAAAEAVRPGGVVVYSVCSFEPEETEAVVAGALEAGLPLAVESVAPYLPHPELESALVGPYLRILPGEFGMDGFFVARLRRVGR
ncbi:MAG: 16S rRNA (cytosine(967)-C(5))-methyltransferase RsmB [Firmicutes bacterium]|nr:16S rRNA (cytosine(967)-C(5))-methyltransferase RsmB [Alicyclobacillaceae bacterium]MCL6496435.1 16S rRNA (cytosine(967)-C(5))-methyltransferase RsmB [Bacillota bacterium]